MNKDSSPQDRAAEQGAWPRRIPFQEVADQGEDWELCLDENERVVYVSPAFQRVTGYGPADMASSAGLLFAMIHPDDRPALEQSNRRCRESRTGDRLEFRIRRRDGGQRWIERACHPVFARDGRDLGWRLIYRDVTDQIDTQQRLSRLQAEAATLGRTEMMAETAGSLAHQLNQPLHALMMEVDLLAHRFRQGKPGDPQKTVERLERIAGLAERAGKIVRSVQSFVRRRQSCFAAVQLDEVVDDLRVLLAKDLQEAGVTLAVDLPAGLRPALGDRPQIAQVLQNLARNALEAMRAARSPERRLLVAARAADGTLHVSVGDTGGGVPAADIERIFDPFYTTKPQGLGMGLGISRSIVEFHGGRIWASRNPQGGTTVHFTLPAAPARPDAGRPA